MQELWYFYREEAYDNNFIKFVKKAGGSKIYLFGGTDAKPDKDVFFALSKGVETEEDKRAV